MSKRLEGKRVLVTQSNNYMGPATVELFEKEGAIVTADSSDLTETEKCQDIVESAGIIDILIANLASENFSGIPTSDLTDEDWNTAFDVMVHPLHKLSRAVITQWSSASALKGMRTLAAYSAARAAQVGYVQSLGVELAPHNIQVNLIAQNYVENPIYYPESLRSQEKFQNSLKRQVPLGRLARAEEDAQFALFLASNESDFFVGQAIPFSGGWVQR